ncbi:MAG: hypothetical protein WDM92_08775 [Caulobacteraceae bacterium]
MTDRLDELLRALPAPTLDHALDQLEPMVWRRIDGGRARPAMAGGGLRFQLAAAGMALVIGLALGWFMTSARETQNRQDALFAGYAEVGPLGRLEGGL